MFDIFDERVDAPADTRCRQGDLPFHASGHDRLVEREIFG